MEGHEKKTSRPAFIHCCTSGDRSRPHVTVCCNQLLTMIYAQLTCLDGWYRPFLANNRYF